MANHGVTGSVIYADTLVGIPGLLIEVVDLDAVPDEQVLNSALTDEAGRFDIRYPGNAYGSLELWPDLVLRVFDPHRRLLYQSDEYADCSVETLAIGTIELARRHVHGWLVTDVFRTPLVDTPLLLSWDNQIEMIVDNQECWKILLQAIDNAERGIDTLQLLIDVGNLTMAFDGDKEPADNTPVRRDDFETAAIAASLRGLPVRALVTEFNDYDVLVGHADSAAEVTDTFDGSGVETRTYKTSYFAPMHIKTTILHDARGPLAIVNGSPLLQEYYDTRRHMIADRRRGQITKYYGTYSQIRLPIHDVSARVRGPVVNVLVECFAWIWNIAAAPGQPAVSMAGSAAPVPDGVAIQVLRTLGPGRDPARPEGETGILQGYQRAIALAKNLIYLENQYFTNLDIVATLLHALELEPALRIILLTNNAVDALGYPDQQLAAIARLRDGARGPDGESRVGVFTVWSHEVPTAPTGARPQIVRNYIHSKVGIVDDCWATLGSANLDGASLNRTIASGEIVLQRGRSCYQHALPRRPDNPLRSAELNLAIYSGVEGLPTTPFVRDLRVELWTEHLGMTGAELQGPADGKRWLALWKQRAEAKCAALKNDPAHPHPARILPWRPYQEPRDYLAALDIPLDPLEVLDRVPGYDLDTGTWR